jgi:anti-anti-sigma factor
VSGPYRHIGASTTNGVLVLTIEDEQIKDSIVAQELRYELVHALNSRQSTQVVMDLRNVTFITSLACVAFIAVKQSMKSNDGRVALCNMSEFIKKLFNAKRLLTRSPNSGNVAFEAAGTLQEAIDMLSSPLESQVKTAPESDA